MNSPPSLSDGALFRLREGGVYWSLLISLYTWSFLFLQYVQTAEVQTTTYIRRKKGKSEHLPLTSPTQKKPSVVTRFPLTRVEEDTFGGGWGADGASSIDL